jgi:protoporphyrinogen oxidase
MFLGAPLAAAACGSSPRRNFVPDGEIVGQSVAVGHRIREFSSHLPQPEKYEEKSIVIVGAGVAGLSAARYLKRQNIHDFIIVELEREPGGTARSGSSKLAGYPWGAHYLPVPFKENADLIDLLEEMNLTEGRDDSGEIIVREEFLCREPEERVFYKGRWYEGLYLHAGAGEEDKRQLSEFQRIIDQWVNWRDNRGRRAFVVPSAFCSTDEQVRSLDQISFDEWLRQHNLTSSRLLWYCDYACRDDYGLRLENTSAWAGLFYFCSRVRQSGMESQPFITFPEGNGRFVKHMAAYAGDNLATGETAVSINPTESGVEVLCLSGDNLRAYRCREVIYSAPVFTAPFVIRGFREQRPFAAEEFQHNAWFVANLFLSDRPRQRFAKDFPLAWDNVLYESPSLGYVNATHQKGIDYGPAIFTYYYPMGGDGNQRWQLFNYSREELAEVCLSDLERAHPDIRNICERIDIMRWGHAMISPRPGFIYGGEREKAMKPFRGIRFAHTDLSGLALFEEAFFHGIRAARECCENPGAVKRK